MKTQRVSICIPTYNRAGLLKGTLEAILSQIDINSTEIIVSDNASTDNTEHIVNNCIKSYPCIRYFRNNTNIGSDENTLACIDYAKGDYIWFCADDDIPLPGAPKKIRSVISDYNPNLIYLNHAGFLENERFDIILKRNSDLDDIVYYDGERMLRDHKLNHFSSTVLKRSIALKFLKEAEEYKRQGYGQGYAFVAIAAHIVLESRCPFVFIGKICLAVRNPQNVEYNPLSVIIIDNACHYQNLRQKGLIGSYTERFILNCLIKGIYKVVLPLKCSKDSRYSKQKERMIIKLYKKYPLFYFYMLPILILPRWVLIGPYWLGRTIKGSMRKIFKLSPF